MRVYSFERTYNNMLSIIFLSSAQREKEIMRKTEINEIFVHGKWESYPRPMSQLPI